MVQDGAEVVESFVDRCEGDGAFVTPETGRSHIVDRGIARCQGGRVNEIDGGGGKMMWWWFRNGNGGSWQLVPA